MSVPILGPAPAGLAATTSPLGGIRILDFSRLLPGPWVTQLLGALGADVLVESFRPGVAAKLGIDAAKARARKPSLIHCAISGFGQTGPLSHIAGHDLVIQAATGVLACHPPSDDPPEVPGFQSADHAGALLSMCAMPLASAMSRPAPGLIEHLAAFLRETGFDAARIAQWAEAGTVAQLGGYG